MIKSNKKVSNKVKKNTSKNSGIKKEKVSIDKKLNKVKVKDDKSSNKLKSVKIENVIVDKKTNKIKENVSNSKIKNVKKDKVKNNNKKVIEEKEILIGNKNYIKKYKFNKERFIRYLLIVLLSCVFVFSVTKLIFNQIDMFKNRRDSKNLVKEVIKWPYIDPSKKDEDNEEKESNVIINPEEVRVDFDKLRATNGDTIGWMMFNNMAVNNPVVHTSDNEYYLYHNFYKKNSEIGTLFMDHRNKSFDDRNVVIFGHSTIDRTMFGSISDVFKSGFFNKENADIIYFYDTNNNLLKYKIFSYYIIESEEYYITTNFKSDESFGEFLNVIKERSIGKLNVEVNASDKIVTLSTCAGSRGSTKRRVVHAKRI